MKILNLYAGIGGNRKLWGDEHEVVAIEYDRATADVYKCYFPDDVVLVADAHEYLLNHYKEFDFIWSSPPCPSHSDIRRCGTHRGQYDAIYPDMGLYQEIILLRNFAPKDANFVVENVRPYYSPLIDPDVFIDRHLYWCNFNVPSFDVTDDRRHMSINDSSEIYGFSLSDTEIKDKRKALRNMVDPDIGLHFLNCSLKTQLPMDIGLFS